MFNFKAKSKIKKKLWLSTSGTTSTSTKVANKGWVTSLPAVNTNFKKRYVLLTKRGSALTEKRPVAFVINFFQKNKFLRIYLSLKNRSLATSDSFASFAVGIKLLQLVSIAGGGLQWRLPNINKDRGTASLANFQSINDYFFSLNQFLKINKNSRWTSMEEIISHFIFYSEGPTLPSGIGYGTVEAPKGHLGVSVVSNGTNKPVRSRIRSSIFVMAGQINALVQGTSLGDFVVIVSGSNIVVGEIDR